MEKFGKMGVFKFLVGIFFYGIETANFEPIVEILTGNQFFRVWLANYFLYMKRDAISGKLKSHQENGFHRKKRQNGGKTNSN